MVAFWADAAQWAERTFGPAQLGDVRRTRRLARCAARIADRPEGPLPPKFDWNELRALYGLRNCPEATHEQVLGPHCRQARAAMGRERVT